MAKIVQIKVAIFPLDGLSLAREVFIADHINLIGNSPREIGFIPITDLYTHKHDPKAIKLACLKEGVVPNAAEQTKLKELGVSAYTYELLNPALFAAANNQQVEAIGFVAQLPKGFHILGATAGLKESQNKDLGVIYSATESYWAGVFTKNHIRAICVDHNREQIKHKIKALFCNSGNANSCTGETGRKNDLQIREQLAKKLKINSQEILTASTGKIGVQLDMNKIDSCIQSLEFNDLKELQSINDFAKAIMTTDTTRKIYQTANMLGFSKGSGMIEPNMATMLAFIISDVKLADVPENKQQETMQEILRNVTDKTFNCISVDGDCSTNDMLIFTSSGLGSEISIQAFTNELTEICRELAIKVVLDGEGNTKLIELEVCNAFSEMHARSIGKSIINSNLVKTAIFGCDPNWGRIIMALGNAGIFECTTAENDPRKIYQPEQIQLEIMGNKVYDEGLPAKQYDSKQERDKLAQLMKKAKTIRIKIDLGIKNSKCPSLKLWGSDLSYEYVRINAEYFT